MFQVKILIITVLITFSDSGRLSLDQTRPYFIIIDGKSVVIHEEEPSVTEQHQLVERDYLSRVRRQVHVSTSRNSDGTSNVNVKVPLVDDDMNKLNAVGSINGASGKGRYKEAEGTLLWENVSPYYLLPAVYHYLFGFESNGHSMSLRGQHTPDAGKKVTASGKANLFHNDVHDLTASAFATRTIPDRPNVPNSSIYGGKLQYINSKGHSAILTGEHNSDIGSQLTAAAKANLFHNNNHDVTADAFITSTFPKNQNIPNANTFGGKLVYSNIHGHEARLMAKHIPNFGNELTATGKATLFHNDRHDFTADAFATKTFSTKPVMPDFNKYGGKLEYIYDNKIGASLGMEYNDLFRRTDYSAMGNFNLFRDRSSSLDLNAGFSKSVSPLMHTSSWNPSGSLQYTRYF